MTTAIGFIGAGAMGAPMAANLAAAGCDVTLWNRTTARAADVAGVTVAESLGAAASRPVVITMLADDHAVEAVCEAPDGLFARLGPGAVHVSMSTISLALVRRLAREHGARQQGFVAAPVFGRPDAAKARMLWVVAGGADTELDRLAPVFAAMGQGCFRFPAAEQAILAKLAGNFLIGATIEALGESLALAEKGGLDPVGLLELLTGTLFGSPVAKAYGGRIARTEFTPPGFTLALARKDFRLILAAAREAGAPMPLAELVADRMSEAHRLGRDGYDFAGLASVIREEAGLPERR